MYFLSRKVHNKTRNAKTCSKISWKENGPQKQFGQSCNMEIEETIMNSCKKCESEFKTKNELKNHNAAAHEEKKIFKCLICSLTFTEKKL